MALALPCSAARLYSLRACAAVASDAHALLVEAGEAILRRRGTEVSRLFEQPRGQRQIARQTAAVGMREPSS